MKKMKKMLLSALIVACTTTTAFAVSSCKDKHEHAYTDTVTAPTCTVAGFTTHTCECGDSYVDTEVPAIGHNYSGAEVTKYPSLNVAGERVSTCANCGDKQVEVIDAISISMPKVSEAIVGLIGSVNVKLALDEGSTIVSISENMESEVAFKLAEAVLNTQDGNLAGHIKLEVELTQTVGGTAETSSGAIYVYVNGDVVSLEMIDETGSNKQEINMTEELYKAISASVGLDYEQVATIAAAGKQLVGYVPAVVNMVQSERPVITEEYVNGLKNLFALVGQDIIKETTDEQGNKTYALDLSALGHFVTDVKDETVASYIDRLYGAGSMDAIKNFVLGLPDKTVRDVVNGAIALGNTYGIDVNNIFYLVNLTARQMGAENFDIEAEIEPHYNKTLGELIIAASGDNTLTVVAMKEMLSSAATMISSLTIDSAYNMIAGADPNYSFTAELESMIAMLPDVLSAELVFNANGAFVKALAFAGEDKVEITVVNGEYHFICIRAGMEVQLTVSAETGFSFSAYRGQELVANVALSNNNGAIGGNVEIDGNDFLDLTIDATSGSIESANVVIRTLEGGYEQEHYNEFTGEWEYVYIPQELVEQTEINYVATVVDGVTTQANATIKGWSGEYDEETYEYVETYGVVATISYTNNDGNINAHLYVEDEARVDLSNEMTDSSNIFTMEIWDLQAGENGDETEQVGEAIFGYEAVDAGTKLFANVMNLDGDEEELLLDAEVIVDDNGNIVSVDYMVDSSNYSGHGHANEYWEGEDLYRDCEDVYPGEVVTLSYVKTENGGAWSTLTTYTETTYTYTERYDFNLGEWVLVGTKNEETETTTAGANIIYALTDNGASITVESVEDGEVVNSVTFTATEAGVRLDTSSYGTDVTFALNEIENGLQFVFDMSEGGNVTADMTFEVTVVNNVLHFGYDLGESEAVGGKGGVSLTIS